MESDVRAFLREQLGRDVTQVDREASLLESGAIDSVGVMQLVAFLEATYGIAVGDDDLMPDNFDTIAAIAAFVERRQARG